MRPAVRYVLATLGLMALLVSAETALSAAARALQFGRPGRIIVGNIAPAVLVLAATVALEKRTCGLGVGAASARLGLGRVVPAQLAVSLLAAVPLAIGAAVIALGMGLPLVPSDAFGWLCLRYLVGAGLMEEVVFRGYLFRHLRKTHSFAASATLAGATFGLVHLLNLTQGLSPGVLAQIGISVTFGFVVTYALAFLYERGRWSLWGCVLLHTCIDWTNVVDNSRWTLRAHVVFLVSASLAASSVFPLARRIGAEPVQATLPR